MVCFKNYLLVFGILAIAYVATCHPQKDGNSRIINGQLITIDKAPYIVQLTDHDGWHFCGGTLISTFHVLTASHCFNGMAPEDVEVVAGVTYRREENGVRAMIAKLIKHPDYVPATKHSDIAVIKLDRPIIGSNTATVPLCQQQVPVNAYLQVSGWGAIEGGAATTQLRTTRIPVRDVAVCKQEFGVYVRKNMICASGYQATGTCFGDSGGPAIYAGQVCGVTAFGGDECGTIGHPAAFSDVYSMRSFIETAMRA